MNNIATLRRARRESLGDAPQAGTARRSQTLCAQQFGLDTVTPMQ